MCLERCLIKLRVAEGGEGFGPSLHRRDKALLARNNLRGFAKLDFSGQVQRQFRFAPQDVEWIITQEKECDRCVHTDASEDRITSLNRVTKPCRSKSIAVAIGWSPEGNGSYRDVNLRPTLDEAALLDKVARKLGETMTFAITMKYGTEHNPPMAIGMR